ncbi:MAG: heme exporter protein CcmB [Candidatus Tectimicrobiota bacterium]
MTVLAQFAALTVKDLRLELRRKESFFTVAFFAILILVVFAFALGPTVTRLKELAPGLIWIAFVFTGVLAVGNAFHVEEANATLEGLLLAPVDRGVLYLSKVAGNVLFILAVHAVLIPVFFVLFNVDRWAVLPPLAWVIVLATVGFAAVGTLLAAVTHVVRAREVLVPLLLLPLAVPLILGAVRSTEVLFHTAGLVEAARWIKLMVAFDALFLAGGYLAFDYVMEL